MIDLKDKHLPPRAILFNKAERTYLQVLGYLQDQDSYVCVPLIPNLPTHGRIATVTFKVEVINQMVQDMRYTLVNAVFVGDRIKFQPMSVIIYDHMATQDNLHLVAMNQYFEGPEGECYVIWVDRGEQVAIVSTKTEPKWWDRKRPEVTVLAVPLKQLLTTHWPVRVDDIWRQFES